MGATFVGAGSRARRFRCVPGPELHGRDDTDALQERKVCCLLTPPQTTEEDTLKAITYRRASTREQGDSGLGLQAQTAALEAAVASKGWEHVADVQDVHTGKSRSGRKGLEAALKMLAEGRADVLLATKLDRLSRSVQDFAELLDTARAQGWKVKVLDPDVDTSSENGALVAGILMQVAQWEARIISRRTRDALAEARKNGTRLGRPTSIPEDVRERIVTMRGDHTLQQIADALDAEQVPTAQGGAKWHVSTVRYVVRSAD